MELQGKDKQELQQELSEFLLNTTTAPSPEWRATTSTPRG